MAKTPKKGAKRNKSGHDDIVEALRVFGLNYPEAHPKSPWPDHFDLAVRNKTFAYLSVLGKPFSISCKLPSSAPMALELPYTVPTGYGLGRSGWVTANYADGDRPDLRLLQSWIDESYRAQAPKTLVKQLEAEPPSTTKKATTKKATTKKATTKKATTKKATTKKATTKKATTKKATTKKATRRTATPTTAGYSGTPLAKKLGIKAAHTLVTIGAPEHFSDIVAPLPPDVKHKAALRGKADVVVFFTTERKTFERKLLAMGKVIHPAGAIWICWPKKASKVPTDMTEGVVREVALPEGLVDVKVCAIDAVWSGLKIVWRKERR